MHYKKELKVLSQSGLCISLISHVVYISLPYKTNGMHDDDFIFESVWVDESKLVAVTVMFIKPAWSNSQTLCLRKLSF